MMETTSLLDIPQAARLLGIKPRTLRGWVAAGKIGHVRLGRLVRLRPEDIGALVQSSYRPAAAAPGSRRS